MKGRLSRCCHAVLKNKQGTVTSSHVNTVAGIPDLQNTSSFIKTFHLELDVSLVEIPSLNVRLHFSPVTLWHGEEKSWLTS